MTEQIITDKPSTLRHIEELYRQGAIDQAKYLELRKSILFKDKKKKKTNNLENYENRLQ